MFPLEQIFIDRFVEDQGEFLNGTPLRPGNTFIFQGAKWDFEGWLENLCRIKPRLESFNESNENEVR